MAAAPVTFGWVSDNGQALSYTFLLFLLVLIAAGLIVTIALRTYPRDVATADASVANTIRNL